MKQFDNTALKLLIDIGNSRIKWTLFSPISGGHFFQEMQARSVGAHVCCSFETGLNPWEALRGQEFEGDVADFFAQDVKWAKANRVFATPIFACAHEQWTTHAAIWRILPIDSVHVCSVAVENLSLDIERFFARTSPNIHVVHAKIADFAANVRNLYRAETLGVDRWLSVIGARALTTSPCIIATAGTALTIDALSQDAFLGGTISPGLRLMRESLTRGTANLPMHEGHWEAFPKTTLDALTSGCVNALVAPILAARARLAALEGVSQENILLLISGGDALLLSEWLPTSAYWVDNLVLIGLARTV